MVGAVGADNHSKRLNEPRADTPANSSVGPGGQCNAAAGLLHGGYGKSRWRALQEILCRSALVTLVVAFMSLIRKTWPKATVPTAGDRSGWWAARKPPIPLF